MDHTLSTCYEHMSTKKWGKNTQNKIFKQDFHSCPFRNEFKPFCMTFILLLIFLYSNIYFVSMFMNCELRIARI